jgi:L-ascorbate metabolism protein UlaG (beta-lactamase superfamily)
MIRFSWLLKDIFRDTYLSLVSGMVYVRWWGHSCFEFRDSIVVLTDPHNGDSMGLPVPRVEPDVVLISHDHDDHANGRYLFEDAHVLDSPCKEGFSGIEFTGLKAFHDDFEGKRMGLNVVFVFELNGVRFAHLGDLGHLLSDEQLENMGDIDVLIVNIGRSDERVDKHIAMVEPRVVIPMHYHIDGIIFPYFPLLKIEEFAKGRSNVRYIGGSETCYSRDKLPEETVFNVFTL